MDKDAQVTPPAKSVHDDEPKPSPENKSVSVEQLNAAVATKAAALTKKLQAEHTAQLQALKDEVATELAAITKEKQVDSNEKLTKAEQEKKDLENRLRLLESTLSDEKEARKKADAEVVLEKREKAIKKSFRKAGGDDDAFDLAYAYLSNKINGDPKALTMKMSIDGDVLDMPLEDAMKSWISKEGARFVKPTQAAGTGDAPRGSNAAPRQPRSKVEPVWSEI